MKIPKDLRKEIARLSGQVARIRALLDIYDLLEDEAVEKAIDKTEEGACSLSLLVQGLYADP